MALVASFKTEIADVRRKIDPSGDVADNASPALSSIRSRLRTQRARLRTTLESFLRGRDTAKYLQEQVVTDRNGRYVMVVRAEHRGAIPGIVHGSSASGASLFSSRSRPSRSTTTSSRSRRKKPRRFAASCWR